jgi:TonB dependent receptor
MRNWEHGAWFQDDWKVNRRFTLNMGLRWEVFTAETEIENRLTNFDIANLKLVYAGVDGTSKSAGKQTHWRNFGPRIGFAYDVSGSGKMVVRGGFGMSYFPEQPSGSNMIGQAIPWTISQNTPAVEPLSARFHQRPAHQQPVHDSHSATTEDDSRTDRRALDLRGCEDGRSGQQRDNSAHETLRSEPGMRKLKLTLPPVTPISRYRGASP